MKVGLKLTRKVELDVLEVLLCHAKHIARVGKEDIATLCILCHVLVFALLEAVEFFFAVGLYPTSFIEMNGFPAATGVVLMFQSVLDDLKLELSHGAHNAAIVELIDKQLRHTFIHQLLQTLLKLLRFHRVIILNVFKQLRRERR